MVFLWHNYGSAEFPPTLVDGDHLSFFLLPTLHQKIVVRWGVSRPICQSYTRRGTTDWGNGELTFWIAARGRGGGGDNGDWPPCWYIPVMALPIERETERERSKALSTYTECAYHWTRTAPVSLPSTIKLMQDTKCWRRSAEGISATDTNLARIAPCGECISDQSRGWLRS